MATEPRVLSGRYRVDALIGQGGMAQVFRGYDLTLGRDVAVKILSRELSRDTAFRTRFRLEAQAASRMSHPSIVRVFDAGEDTETEGSITRSVPYIVMELVEGTTLKDILAEKPVSVEDAVRYTDGILEALEYSHRAGVVHRDIKPGNVMVTTTGQVKVMDFGIARAVSDSSSTVAETTQIIGTASYFSPEQAKGEQVDARADLYSTGVVLYEMLTGRPPFRGESPVAVAYQHVSETPLPPSEENEESPLALDPVVLRALAKDPFQRFQDAAGFRTALEGAVSGKVPSKKDVAALTSELYGPSPRQAAETARSLRQLSADTTMTRTQSGPPVAWIWAGVALLAVLVVSVFIWVVTLPPKVDVDTDSRKVPAISTMAFERAEQVLADNDLTAVRLDEANPDVPKGNVIRTDPAEGVSVAAGHEVTVYVSTGAEMTVMPSLAGLTLDAAKAQIAKAGLAVGIIRQHNDPELSAGTVIEASIDAEEEVAPGTVIDLEVASGKVILNDLQGFPLETAKREVEDLALEPRLVEDADCAATEGQNIISTNPGPGDVAVHSRVDLVFCTGPAEKN